MILRRPGGMVGFTVVWFGQFVSLIGTGMSRFALTIWAWEITGQATALALVGFFSFAPVVLFSPLAGALVDRIPRKTVMIASDLAAGLSTIVVLVLYLAGHLEIWHLYAAGFFAGAFESFQFPAYSSAISLMVHKRHYTRANAMLGLAGSASGIISPVLAGALLAFVGIDRVLLIDIGTFIIAITVLLFVSIPDPEREPVTERKGLLHESLFGFRYTFSNRSLTGLQLIFLAVNIIAPLGFAVLAPMILSRSGGNELALATVQMALGLGGVVGGVILSIWGGPRRRIHGTLIGMALTGILGQFVLGVGRSLTAWSIGAFFAMFFIPFINGSNQAIWQAKVPPRIQGRVFAARRLIAQIGAPLAMLSAGPLADHVLEPGMMMREGGLTAWFGGLVGTGPGAGMGLMFVLAGILSACIGVAGYLVPSVRDVERILPDSDDTP